MGPRRVRMRSGEGFTVRNCIFYQYQIPFVFFYLYIVFFLILLHITENLPIGSIILAPRGEKMKVIEENAQYLRSGNLPTLMQGAMAVTGSPFFLDVAYYFVDMSCKLRTLLHKNCQSQNKPPWPCPDLPPFQKTISYTTKQCMFLSDISKIANTFSAQLIKTSLIVEIGKFYAKKSELTFLLNPNISIEFSYLRFDRIDECNRNEIPQETVDHRAVSLKENDRKKLALFWRQESWVGAIVSISTVGFLCSLAVFTFLLVRIIKGDVLEGNPSFSFLLLLSIDCTYCSVIPFSISSDHLFQGWLICELRIFGGSISYALLFSIMLSRSFMLASCDKDGGLMTHVNGYLQGALFFFILGVQIGLSVELWVMNSDLFNSNNCSAIYKNNLFLIFQSYNMFLLLLLACISPFIVQSKRNYREGLFFCIATFLCIIVFASWCVAYLMVPSKWQDAAVTGGLAGMATVVLVTVFIPRTYLMMSAMVRDEITSSLPTIAFSSGASEQDLNYQSSQALYDTVAPQFVVQSQETVDAAVPKTSTQERSTSPEYSYERYDSPPSPHKVTSL